MRYVYLSRRLNRSGYRILQHLLDEGHFLPEAIILPESGSDHPLDDPGLREADIQKYQDACSLSGCRPLRFHGSIPQLARERGVPIYLLTTIKNENAQCLFRKINPDLIVLGGGWPELLPEWLIEVPPLGVINTHPSLLPEYRGTDVHRWQVYAGVKTSGTTIHVIDNMFDTGAILAQSSIPIPASHTPQELADDLAWIAAPLMSRVLNEIALTAPDRIKGQAQPKRMDQLCYFSRWKWESLDFLRLDWTRDALELQRFVRACTQEAFRYNGPHFKNRGRFFLLRTAGLTHHDGSGSPGEVLRCDDLGIVVRCGTPDMALRMIQIQPASVEHWRASQHPNPVFYAGRLLDEGVFAEGDLLDDSPESF